MEMLLATKSLQNTLIFLTIGIVLTIVIVFVARYLANNRIRYSKKDKYVTPTELKYMEVIKEIIGDEFLLFPQVNLASVIKKETPGFRTELFRNADFGIFTKDYAPLMLIEINDSTHEMASRVERDESVNEICAKAKLPLVTFWVNEGIDKAKIRRALWKYL